MENVDRRGFLKFLGLGAAIPVAAILPKVPPKLSDEQKAALEKYHGASIGALVIGDGVTLKNFDIRATETGLVIQSKSDPPPAHWLDKGYIVNEETGLDIPYTSHRGELT